VDEERSIDVELERVRPLLEDVASDGEVELVVSVIVSDDEGTWLLERLADALRD
jgi:hypothetical protein